jgi:hypothetical protein
VDEKVHGGDALSTHTTSHAHALEDARRGR